MQKLLQSDFHRHNFRLFLTFLFLLSGGLIYGQYLNSAPISLPLSIKSQGVFILKVDEKGRLYDEQATEKEYEQYLSKQGKLQNYTLVNSLNQPEAVRGLKIILRATDQLIANPEALMSFRRAAARWERAITTPITVVIDVDYGPTRWGETWGDGVLGSTRSALDAVSINNQLGKVADVVNALKSKHADDPQLLNLYNAIPIPTPSTTGKNLDIAIFPQIVAQALGFLPAETNPDPEVNPLDNVPSIGFNSNFPYDFDPSDGIDGNSEDFDATVVHEMGHALGFVSMIGNGGDPYNFFTPLDLFRVRPEAVESGSLTGFASAERILTPGPPPSDVLTTIGGQTYYKANHVFFDGVNEIELSTATGAREGGDGQQASHWRDDALRLPSLGAERTIGIMDPTSSGTGIRSIMNNHDIRAFEVMGFNVNYSLKYAGISIKFGGNTLDLDKSSDTVRLGDVNISSSRNVPLEFINLSLDNSLNYEVEVIPVTKVPQGASSILSLNSIEGTIPAGLTTNVNVTLNGGPEPSVYFGILRIHTNDENRLVIDIPFEFSTGNATAPAISFSTSKLEDFRFERSTTVDSLSQEITIHNNGNLSLSYKLLTSLTTKSNYPQEKSSLAKSGSSYLNNLSRFFDSEGINEKLIFSCDFENGFGGFTKSGYRSEDWRLMTGGRAALDGHSKPTAAYFGVASADSTRPNTSAMLISPNIDLSTTPTRDLVTLSFNYYLNAEEDFDFASVLVSNDGGNTFSEIATSDGGILVNTTEWQSVMIQIPYLSGNSEPVQVAFKFTSDTLINLEGFYIDDVQVHAIENANLVYTSVRGGVITGNENSVVTLTANKSNLQKGYYHGALTVLSNDPRNSRKDFLFNVGNLQVNIASLNTLYGVTYRNNGRLLNVNPSSGATIEYGPAGMDACKSLAINPVTLQMYAINIVNDANNIILVDAKEGLGLFYTRPDVNLDAIAFDQNGNLYGTGNDVNLYKVNLQTGITELVKQIDFKVSAMVFHPSTGELWMCVDAANDKDRIYKLNVSSGELTLVGKTGLAKTMRGIAFNINGDLFGVAGEILQVSTLYSINTQTAAATQIGATTFKGIYGLTMKPDTSTSVDEESPVASRFELSQNYPNPFNPATVINYQVPENGFVTLKVFNLLGQQVATLVNKEQSTGKYSIQFNAENLSTGIYFYELRVNSHVSVKKMMLTK